MEVFYFKLIEGKVYVKQNLNDRQIDVTDIQEMLALQVIVSSSRESLRRD